jgi:hypothetical protein
MRKLDAILKRGYRRIDNAIEHVIRKHEGCLEGELILCGDTWTDEIQLKEEKRQARRKYDAVHEDMYIRYYQSQLRTLQDQAQSGSPYQRALAQLQADAQLYGHGFLNYNPLDDVRAVRTNNVFPLKPQP